MSALTYYLIYRSFDDRFRTFLLRCALSHISDNFVMIDFTKDQFPEAAFRRLGYLIVEVQCHWLGLLIELKGSAVEFQEIRIRAYWPVRDRILHLWHCLSGRRL